MKNLLRLEELAQFVACLVCLGAFSGPWWFYLLLVIGPDIGMLGYLINRWVGAWSYNVLHHKAVALAIAAAGVLAQYFYASATYWSVWDDHLEVAGIILYGHASMDRIFGYGLKFGDNFHHTHLGWIGKLKGKEQEK
jgi:Domain of unknown function (DUF4260)